MTHCTNQSAVTGEYHAGGIVGLYDQELIDYCFNSGNVVSTGYGAGGVAETASKINKCYNTGNITCAMDETNYGGKVGGIAVYANKITNCYNTGKIVGVAGAGGILYCYGISTDGYVAIENCYNLGNITAAQTKNYTQSTYFGGILTLGSGTNIVNCYNHGYVTYPYSTTSASRVDLGGIIGGAGTLTNCYNDGDITCELKDTDKIYIGGISSDYASKYDLTECYNIGKIQGTVAESKKSKTEFLSILNNNSGLIKWELRDAIDGDSSSGIFAYDLEF